MPHAGPRIASISWPGGGMNVVMMRMRAGNVVDGLRGGHRAGTYHVLCTAA